MRPKTPQDIPSWEHQGVRWRNCSPRDYQGYSNPGPILKKIQPRSNPGPWAQAGGIRNGRRTAQKTQDNDKTTLDAAPRQPKTARRRQGGARRLPRDCPELAQDNPKHFQDATKMPLRRPKMPPRRPRTLPRRPPRRTKNPPRCSKNPAISRSLKRSVLFKKIHSGRPPSLIANS